MNRQFCQNCGMELEREYSLDTLNEPKFVENDGDNESEGRWMIQMEFKERCNYCKECFGDGFTINDYFENEKGAQEYYNRVIHELHLWRLSIFFSQII